VCEVELIDELLIGRRLLQRVEVNSVKVLDYGLFEREPVVDVDLYQDGHELEFGEDRGAPAAFAGDQLVLTLFPFDWTHNDRLQDAELLHRRGEGHETVIIDRLARLVGIRTNRLERDATEGTFGLRGSWGDGAWYFVVGYKGAESLTQSWFPSHS
jgi:hypothetical protein